VELVFENTQGRLAGNLADRSEIAIKRVVTRDAQSLYFLNGSKCRRRDITDIFLGTGLGPRSYAIIEQGMISRLIESKPQELRVFIEEAAGISRYKERRRETENRIKHTRDNLDRLTDVREELGKNIDKLKRQAATAQRYKELKAQERKLRAELTTIKWLGFNDTLNKLEQQLREQETELQKYQAAQAGDERVLTELREQANAARQQQEQCQQQYYQLGNRNSALEQQIVGQRQQQQLLSQQIQQKQLSLAGFHEQQQQEQQQRAELEAQLEELIPELLVLTEQQEDLQAQLLEATEQAAEAQLNWQDWQQQHYQRREQLQQWRLQLQHWAQQQHQLAAQQHKLTEQLARLEPEQAEQELALAEAGHQELAEQVAALQLEQTELTNTLAQQQQLSAQATQQRQQWQNQQQVLRIEQQRLSHSQQQAGSSGPLLAEQLQIADGWALAVTLALGALQQAELAAHDEGKALYVTAAAGDKAAPANTLASVVRSGMYPDYFRQILLAADEAQALTMLAQLKPGQSVICAQGKWFGANWGQQSQASLTDSRLLRQERLQQLGQELAEVEQELAAAAAAEQQQLELQQQAQQQLSQLNAALSSQQQTLQQQHTVVQLKQQALQQLRQQSTQLQQQLAELQLQQQALAASAEQTELQLAEAEQEYQQALTQEQQLQQRQQQARAQEEALRQQLQQQQGQHSQLQMQQRLCQQQLQSVELSLSRAALQQQQWLEQLVELQLQLDEQQEPALQLQEELQESLLQRSDAEQALISANQQLAAIQQQIRELEQGQSGITQRLSSQQKALENLRLDAEGYRIRANNMLELLREQQVNMKEVLGQLPADADEAQWQQQLDKTVEAVSRLGAINLAAIEEYEQQAERKAYLDAQHQDLSSALETLETAIRKIDRETRQRFKETFEQVNDGLKQLFPKVFGGGSAYLDLTDDDLLETGVSIMARPPGKKNSTIHLLSGGEKALTALSLVFSIFRLNPAPFCMLDEVDAPLDDANVGRFCNLVREMSDTVQFIYISHNKIAMEMAAQLMGVTMQEPGVSRVVAVDVDDAVKLAVA
ncbi:MAG: chromosome segregation protein SMC, partial [Alishewanella sp. 34-51-39]